MSVSAEQNCPACSKLAGSIVSQEAWHRMRCGLENRDHLKRVHIVGGPGSGKSTLARSLGALLKTRVYELDKIAFVGPDFLPRPLDERLADLYQIACQPAWITEGMFVTWTEELLDRADMIVWLDHIGWSKSVWRIMHRFTGHALREVQYRQGTEKVFRFKDYARNLKQLLQVVFSTRAYFKDASTQPASGIETRRNTALCLSSYADKVIHCSSDQGVRNFLEYIQFCYR